MVIVYVCLVIFLSVFVAMGAYLMYEFSDAREAEFRKQSQKIRI